MPTLEESQHTISYRTYRYLRCSTDGTIQVRYTSTFLYCLSNAIHGLNINLPVCVCVSVTLFVNSPTGQTSQLIFTVDSLKDADLRKDVPFAGLDDE